MSDDFIESADRVFEQVGKRNRRKNSRLLISERLAAKVKRLT